VAGFGTSTEEMGAVAGKVRGEGEAAKPVIDKLTATEVTAADFGKLHADAFQAYTTGLAKLTKCAQSFVTANADFASRLDQSKGGYEWVDAGNAADLGKK
jgi:hypothetical protein